MTFDSYYLDIIFFIGCIYIVKARNLQLCQRSSVKRRCKFSLKWLCYTSVLSTGMFLQVVVGSFLKTEVV